MLKVQNTLKVAKGLLADLSGMANLESSSNDMVRTIRDFENNLFNEWSTGIEHALENPSEQAKFEMSG